MVSQSLTTAQSSTNHHKEQKRNGLKTSAKHSGLIFIHQKKKKKEVVQRAAGSPSWALEAPGEPGSVQAREQGLALQALWGLLISISQVRWLVWLRLLQHLLTMVSQNARSQPKLRQHWESKLLSSPMGLIHRMTPPTEHRHFVKGGFPASQYAPPSPSPALNLNVRDQGKGLAKRRRDHCPIS